jgi:protease II
LVAAQGATSNLQHLLARPHTQRTRTILRNEIGGYAQTSAQGDSAEPRGAFLYWAAIPAGETQLCYYRLPLQHRRGQAPLPVLDLNDLAHQCGQPVSLSFLAVSPDHSQRYVLFAVDTDGGDRPKLFLKHLIARRSSGHPEAQLLVEGCSNAVWLPYREGKPFAVLYTRLDDKNRAHRVFKHVLGTDPRADVCVYDELDEEAFVSVVASKDHSFVTVNVNSRDCSRVMIYVDGDDECGAELLPGQSEQSHGGSSEPPGGVPRLLHVLPPGDSHALLERDACAGLGLQYYLARFDDRLFMVTNAGGAPNYQILTASMAELLAASKTGVRGTVAKASENPLSSSVAGAAPGAAAPPPIQAAEASTPFGSAAAHLNSRPSVAQDSTLAGSTAEFSVSPVSVSWTPFLPHRGDTLLDDIEVCGENLVVFETRDDAPQLLVIPLAPHDCDSHSTAIGADSMTESHDLPLTQTYSTGTASPPSGGPPGSYYIPLPLGTVEIAGGANADVSSQLFRFTAHSTTEPPQDYEWNLRRRSLRQVVHRQPGTASGRPLFAGQDYTSYRLLAPSWDGVSVPVTVVHRTDIGIDVDAVKDVSARLAQLSSAWRDAQAEVGSQTTFGGGMGQAAGGMQSDARVSPVSQLLAAACAGWDDWRYEAGLPVEGLSAPERPPPQREIVAWYPLRPGPCPAPLPPQRSQFTEQQCQLWARQPLGRLQQALSQLSTADVLAAVAAGNTAWLSPLLSSTSAYAASTGLHMLAASVTHALSDIRLGGLLEGRGGPSGASSVAYRQQMRRAALQAAGSGEWALDLPRAQDWRHNNPTLLHAYGAYGASLSAAFDPARLPMLSRGWAMAFAHVRGGGELGVAQWYHRGRGASKHNTLHDAVAAARLLIGTGLARSRYLALRTESAGGVVGGESRVGRGGACEGGQGRIGLLRSSRVSQKPSLCSATEGAAYPYALRARGSGELICIDRLRQWRVHALIG